MRRSTPLLAMVLLAALPACGGDGDGVAPTTAVETTTSVSEDGSGEGAASAEAYAEEVCGSIGSWYDEIDTASTALVGEAEALSDEDPSAGKDLVIGFLDDAVGFTDALIADLEGAGAPDTEEGAQTADELVAGIRDVRELFQGARDDTAALPGDDPAALGSGLQGIGTALQEGASAVGANFQEVLSSVEDPELSAAFESAESCQELATSG